MSALISSLSRRAPRFALAAAILLLAAAPVRAQQPTALAAAATETRMIVAARSLRPGDVISEADLAISLRDGGPGVATDIADVVGQETRVAIFRGRPVRTRHLGPPTVVRRNEVISIVFRRGGLVLRTEARALDRGAIGARIRAQNVDSRRTVFVTVTGPAKATVE